MRGVWVVGVTRYSMLDTRYSMLDNPGWLTPNHEARMDLCAYGGNEICGAKVSGPEGSGCQKPPYFVVEIAARSAQGRLALLGVMTEVRLLLAGGND